MRYVVIISCCLFLLTGCWDRRELKEIGIVKAIGIDRDQDTGEILFTSQVLIPSALKPEGGGAKSPVLLITTKGDTVFKAIRNAYQEFDRKNVYAHNNLIVIGENLAREGILSVLDGITRGTEARGYVWLCVAKDKQARDILGIKQQGIENVQANYLNGILYNHQNNLDTTVLKLNEYYDKSLSEGINPVTGVLTTINKTNTPVEGVSEKKSKKIRLSGGAVFNKDKLVGFLNEKEVHGFNWIVGEVKNRVLTIPSILEKGKLVSIEIRDVSAKINPLMNKNKIIFNIEINTTGILVEEEGQGSLKTRKEQLDYLNELGKNLNLVIERQVKQVLTKTQKQLKTDIFGFGKKLNEEYPGKWKSIKGHWEDEFQNTTVRVKVNSDIEGQELLNGPLKSR